MNFLDVVFLLILGIAALRGYKKGVVTTLTSVAGYVVGLIGTLLFYQPLQIFLTKQVHLPEKLAPWMTEILALPTSSQKITDMAMDKAVQIINQKEMPAAFKESMIKYVQDFSKLPATKGINTLGEGIGYTLGDFMTSIICFVILFSGLALVFRIVLPKLFKTVSPKPVTFIDKLGGAVLGTGGGLMSVLVLVIVLIPIASMGALKGNSSPLATQMHDSFVVDIVMNRMETLLKMIFSSSGF